MSVSRGAAEGKSERVRVSSCRRLLVAAAVAGYTGLFCWLLWKNRTVLGYFSWSMTAAGLLAVALALAANGMINYHLFRSAAAGLKVGEGLKLALLNSAGNYLPLSAGLFGKGFYLNRGYGLGYGTYISRTFMMMVWHVSLSGMAGLAAVYRIGLGEPEVAGAFALLAAAGVVLLLPVQRLLPGPLGAVRYSLGDLRKLIVAEGAWLFAWQGLYLVFHALLLMVCFRLVGQGPGFWEVLLYAAGLTLSRFMNLLPGGIGAQEVIVVTIGLYTGLDADMAILGVGVARAMAMAVVFTWAGLAFGADLLRVLGKQEEG